ncbi:hypothetical protein EJK50_1033 [Moraxella catarrhalis]|nr:hypothetical protein EJK50_1033 [Moraxella catarrhalis]
MLYSGVFWHNFGIILVRYYCSKAKQNWQFWVNQAFLHA